ncbi:MAG: AAA family ATPase [Verrucomicrobiales bacterium]
MRFSRLHIQAYGPFTDFHLSLPQGPRDLHLIYGPNEAGKSSLLRAIRGLLFGIPGQSTDNFLHDYSQLRIAADLEMPGGQARRFQRRKGNKNTLLDDRAQPLPDSELTKCLGDVDAAYFDSMFGLDGTGLRSGADALLRGHGRLGEALFSASLGGTPVDVVIRDLEKEAAEIFSGKAQRRLRQSLHAHAEHLRRKKEALVKPEDWEEIERQLNEVEARLSDLQSRRQELTNRTTWLLRCRDALALVGKLREHERQLAALPAMEGLPESFARDLLKVRTASETKEKEVQQLNAELAAIREKMAGCTPNRAVLEWESSIQQIHAQLGVFTANKSARFEKQAEAATVRETIAQMCRDLGIGEAIENLESFRLTQIQYAEARERADFLNHAAENVALAEKRVAELARNIERRDREKVAVDETRLAILKSLHEQATALQDKAAHLPARRKALQARNQSLADLHRELVGAPNNYQQTSELPVPTKASLDHFRSRWEEVERSIRASHDKVGQIRGQKKDQETEISNLLRLKNIPDHQQLADAREHRDRGWRLVLQDWKGEGAVEELEPGRPLEDAYPEAVSRADQISDRLRAEASAVAQVEEKRLQLATLTEKLRDEESRQTELQQQEDTLRQEWASAWQPCGITPQTPTEMLGWREAWREFRRAWTEFETERQTLAADEESVESTRAAMADGLRGGQSGFAVLRRRLDEELERGQLARANQLADEKRHLDDAQELKSIQESLETGRTELQTVRNQWGQLAVALAIPADLSPARAMDLLDGRRDLFREIDRLRAVESAVRQLDASIAQFENRVEEAADGAGFSRATPEVLAHGLWTALVAAQQARQHLDSLHQIETEKNERRQQTLREHAALETELAAHLTRAGLSSAAAADGFSSDFERAHERRRNIAHFRESLAGLARGEAVDAFIVRVAEEDPGGLEGELAGLAQELTDVEQQQEEAWNQRQTVAAEKAVLEKAGDAAARSEQRAQFEEGRMLADARRYIDLQAALGLLKGQINRFREQNQGPFLSKASHWFALLTGGGFKGIITTFADGDEPTIAGRRAGAASHQEVPVAGMSEGTRDQLYLALRLAGLQLHLEDHDPMPLILDDLLVHFDDERATHALRALHQMSGNCQVLLFTHHHHMLDLARQSLEQTTFTVHTIQAGVASPASTSPSDVSSMASP